MSDAPSRTSQDRPAQPSEQWEADGRQICLADSLTVVAYATDFNGGGNRRARLIAAAPDLLEQLRRLTDDYESLLDCGDCGNSLPGAQDQHIIDARAAIAKATGR